MNYIRKLNLKALSFPYIDLKKYYRLIRKMKNAALSPHNPLYHLSDHRIFADDREIPIRVFSPDEHEMSKLLIFFHGGGWVTGNIDSYTNVCANMANQTKHTVISVDYRLAPEHPFPAGVEDCYLATKEVFSHHHFFHCEQQDITLIGDSAGANMAAVVSLMARDRGEFLPCKQILIYPSTYHDHSSNSPFPSIRENGTDYLLTAQRLEDYMELYAPNKKDRLTPYVAPLLEKNLSEQPGTLIITAEFDPLRDEGEAYGLRLEKADNQVLTYRMKDAVHGFFSLPWNSKYVIQCYQIMNHFLNKEWDCKE